MMTGATVASRVMCRVAGVDLAGVTPVWWLVWVVQGGVGWVAGAATGDLAAARGITVGAPVLPHISRVQLRGLAGTVASLATLLATEARVERKKSRVRLVDISRWVREVFSREL